MNQLIAPTERQCKGCGIGFVTTDARKWFHKSGCGRFKRERQTNDWLLANRPHLPTEPCLNCGKPVVQHRKRRHDGELRHCSYRCAFENTGARERLGKFKLAMVRPANWPPVQTNGQSCAIPKGCIECGTGRRIGRCRDHGRQMFVLRQMVWTRLRWLLPRTCERCGDVWQGWGTRNTLCSECLQASKVLRRARRRAMLESGDNTITLKRVWEQCKGVCHLCGQRTDLPSVWQGWNARQEWMPTAPTIDHVLALANGGTHTWHNVALAHNVCNSTKSDNL